MNFNVWISLVAATVSGVKGYVQAPISLDPGAVPPWSTEREQIHKVLENLLTTDLTILAGLWMDIRRRKGKKA